MSDENLTRFYGGEAGREYHAGKRNMPEAAYRWIARSRAAKLAPYVRPGDDVLEFGVGSGWNLAALPCRRKVGCDLTESLEPVVRAHGIEFVDDIAGLPEASFDVVLSHHSLEHVLHPAATLLSLRRLLRVGGRLILFVPYEKERRYRRWQAGEPNHHLHSWNVQTFGNLADACGFAVKDGRVTRYGYDRFAGVWSARLHLGGWGFRLLRRAMLLVRPLYEVRIIAERTG